MWRKLQILLWKPNGANTGSSCDRDCRMSAQRLSLFPYSVIPLLAWFMWRLDHPPNDWEKAASLQMSELEITRDWSVITLGFGNVCERIWETFPHSLGWSILLVTLPHLVVMAGTAAVISQPQSRPTGRYSWHCEDGRVERDGRSPGPGCQPLCQTSCHMVSWFPPHSLSSPYLPVPLQVFVSKIKLSDESNIGTRTQKSVPSLVLSHSLHDPSALFICQGNFTKHTLQMMPWLVEALETLPLFVQADVVQPSNKLLLNHAPWFVYSSLKILAFLWIQWQCMPIFRGD